RARESRARREGLRASEVAYDQQQARILLELTNGTLFGFSPSSIPAIRHLTADEVASVTLSPGGSGLLWDALDIQLSVPGILIAAFGRSALFREMGRIAGKTRSEAKASAARRNGKKGGRPKARR
ncbi:MAG TPA: DUF2442 domain-containing protein, partial [Gemmatimonadaceae bacterium]|nr:DUF2442 domain-containing protein [Gemmatimonadaceae bacterium]